MSTATTNNNLNVEQYLKLLQQHLMLWSKPEGLEKVYTQASHLAHRFDIAYNQYPSKWIAQLYQHKPHFDYITNITFKSMILTAIIVNQLRWPSHSRQSLLSAALTANIASLSVLTRQANQHPLTDKHKAILARSLALSYKLLTKHQVLDPLWLNAIAGAVNSKLRTQYPLGLQGNIIHLSTRLGKLLANPQKAQQLNLLHLVRQMYYESTNSKEQQVVQLLCQKLHKFGDGTPVLLHNKQIAILVQLAPDAIIIESESSDAAQTDEPPIIEREHGFVAFIFEQAPDGNGRLAIIAHKHIAARCNLLCCDNPKVYSQLWESPLERFLADKGIEKSLDTHVAQLLDQPPEMLKQIEGGLLEQHSLTKLTAIIEQSSQLTELLTKTASQSASADIKIKDVKHALAMLGLNRVGPLLTQGALTDIIYSHQFPGFEQLQHKLESLIQAIKYYNQYNDLEPTENLVMYMSFYLAPIYLNPQLQTHGSKLHKPRHIKSDNIFCLESFVGISKNENYSKQTQALVRAWQLPKVCQELFKYLHQPRTSNIPANRINHNLAVIKLAIMQCQMIYNQVELKSPYIKQKIDIQLEILNIRPDQYPHIRQAFFDFYSPFTPV